MQTQNQNQDSGPSPASEKPVAPLSAAQRWGLKLVRLEVMLGITVVLFLLLDGWAARRLSHGGGLEMAEEAWWLESDSRASAPWMNDYVKEFQRSRIKWTP